MNTYGRITKEEVAAIRAGEGLSPIEDRLLGEIEKLIGEKESLERSLNSALDALEAVMELRKIERQR